MWLLFVACLWPLKRLTGSWLHGAALLAFAPVVQSLQATQSTPLLLLGVLLWVLLLSEGKDFWAGAALALALVKPHLAIALGLPLIVVNRKAFLGFVCGSVVIGAYSLALVGPEGIRGMLSITQTMATTDGYFVRRELMFNLAGFLNRAGLSLAIVWPAYFIGIAIISVLWRRFGLRLQTIGPAVVIALFLAPHLHLHDLTLLIIPMLVLPMWTPFVASAVIGVGFGYWWLYPSVNGLMLMLGYASFRQGLPQHERELATLQSVPALSND